VLLPGYGGKPEENFPETKLFNVAYVHNILTISISESEEIYADEQVIDKLNQIMADITKKYAVPKDKLL